MKHSPGKIVLLLLLIFGALSLEASTYLWEAHSKKSMLYMNEAVEVEYICRFDDEAYQYVIEFSPPKEGEGYRMYRLSETERIINEKRVNRYRFVVFFESSGSIQLDFGALMRRTSKESIENTVIGRDNVEDFSFTDTKTVLPILNFDVQDHSAALTGSFALTVTMDKQSVDAYESIPLTIEVEGVGDFDRFIPFDLTMEGVDLFKETPQKNLILTADGFQGTWTERYALIPQHDFVLPEFTLRYFDPGSKRVQILKSAPIKVSVAADTAPEELLDNEEELSAEWSWDFIYYLLTLLTGVILGRYLRIAPLHTLDETTVYAQLQRCSDPKRFVTLLVLLNDRTFEGMILELDQQIKKGRTVNLQKYKKALKNREPEASAKRTKIEVMALGVMDKLVKKDSKK